MTFLECVHIYMYIDIFIYLYAYIHIQYILYIRAVSQKPCSICNFCGYSRRRKGCCSRAIFTRFRCEPGMFKKKPVSLKGV